MHPNTGEIITKYYKLANDPKKRELWTTVFGKYTGSLPQGNSKTVGKGTNSLFLLTHQEIGEILTYRVFTYVILLVNYHPQKEDPNWVCLKTGGNLITYTGYDTTRTANLMTSTILWHSVLSIAREKYICIEIKNFYLCAKIDRYEYIRMKLTHFPMHVQQQ